MSTPEGTPPDRTPSAAAPGAAGAPAAGAPNARRGALSGRSASATSGWPSVASSAASWRRRCCSRSSTCSSSGACCRRSARRASPTARSCCRASSRSTLFFTALQNTALPLVIEFSFTKEIEDRLLAPLPAWAVGIQKIVVAAVRGIVGAMIILPLAAVILPGGVEFSDISWPGFVGVMLVGPLAGAAVGLVLGTAVDARQINVVFAVVLTPLLFTGATFYPWAALDSLRGSRSSR